MIAMARHHTPLELKGEILSLAEVSVFLHVSPATIHRLLKAQELPAFRVGREWRFFLKSIDRWRKGQEQTAKVESGYRRSH
jgi:excisionase family DNA binding protein